MKTGRTIGYARCSTVGQAEDGYSLEVQRRKIQAYCDLHDLDLAEIIEDAGLSGKSVAGRPGMLRIIELVKSGTVDNVVILKLDRMARNLKEACELAELMQKKHVALHSVSEKIDTASATGRLFYNVISAMAAWERETISERTTAALAVKRANGERISGKAPYGYEFQAGMLLVNDREQETIATMQDLHGQGYSIRGIIQFLTDHGYTNRKNNPFGVSEVCRILKKAA